MHFVDTLQKADFMGCQMKRFATPFEETAGPSIGLSLRIVVGVPAAEVGWILLVAKMYSIQAIVSLARGG